MSGDRCYITAFVGVTRRKDLAASAKLVWLYLRDRQGKNDVAWPSIATIADELGLSRRCVMTSLGQLEKAKLIERRGRRQVPGTHESRWPNAYHCSPGADSAPLAESASTPGRICTGPRAESARDPGQNLPPNLSREPTKEPSREPTRARGSGSSSDRGASIAAESYRRGYERAKGGRVRWAGDDVHRKSFAAIARQAGAQPAGLEAALDQALGHFFADDFAARSDYSPSHLARCFTRYLDPPPAPLTAEAREALRDEAAELRRKVQWADEKYRHERSLRGEGAAEPFKARREQLAAELRDIEARLRAEHPGPARVEPAEVARAAGGQR